MSQFGRCKADLSLEFGLSRRPPYEDLVCAVIVSPSVLFDVVISERARIQLDLNVLRLAWPKQDFLKSFQFLWRPADSSVHSSDINLGDFGCGRSEEHTSELQSHFFISY